MIASTTVLLGLALSTVSAQLVVTTLPNVLFEDEDMTHKIVSGSVIQLYCSATSTTATPIITWTTAGMAVINDPPHIRIRNSSNNTEMSATTSLLIDNFGPLDDGNYACHVTDGTATADKATIIINAFSKFTGALHVTRDPATRERVYENNTILPLDNRTAVTLGSTIDHVNTPDFDNVLRCECGHIGDDTNFNFLPPSVVWVKNGESITTDSRVTITESTTYLDQRRASILRISNFSLSDAGVYQCIFIDVDSDREVITTTPLRLDTGSVLQLESVTPQLVVLNPPEKLVIEVQASGGYQKIQWFKNQIPFNSTNRTDPYFVRLPDEFSNFFEIFVREPTTVNDLGVYVVQLLSTDPNPQTEVIHVPHVVTQHEPPNTVSQQTTTVTVHEGGSVDISCTSTGTPIPTISWELHGSPAPFPQRDSVTDFLVDIPEFGDFSFTPGNINSRLSITNASFPAHNGEYICAGHNSHRGIESRTHSSITVQVWVVPEVQLTASPQAVLSGGSAILNCSVIRANPRDYNFTWTRGDGPTTVKLSETRNTLTLSPVTESDFGVYRCTVNNTAGKGTGMVVLQQGTTDSTPTATDSSTTDSSTAVTPSSPSPTALSQATVLAVVFSVVGGIVIVLVAVIVILLITRLIVRGTMDPRRRRRSEVSDSQLIPFDESPVFGITPADDQYIYGQQNWSDYTISFGFDNHGELTFDEHSFDKHMFEEEQFDNSLTTID